MSKSLLIIAHTPSKNTRALADAGIGACKNASSINVNTRLLSPFKVKSVDVITADSIIIGTTENIGYMAGATKDMFDRCYNDWLGQTEAKPLGVYIRAGLDGTATKKALASIFVGLKWRLVAEPLVLRGVWREQFCDDVSDLCLGIANGLDLGIF